MNNKTTEKETYEVTTRPGRNYKDTIFRMLFSDSRELLILYNAVNGTDYDNPDELTVTTLENAIFMTVKNDISCVVDMRLNLYEHQSTFNPNLPNPKFIVFYNGEKEQPALRRMYLSDAYVHKEEEPSLELVVTQININRGYNDNLMKKCPTLKGYMQYVDKIREYQREMLLSEAVERAVDECINEGILVDFLKKNKSEVISMSIYEYDEKLHEKTLLEIGREEGREEGIKGSVTILKKLGLPPEKIKEQLADTYGLNQQEAEEYLKQEI